MDPMEYSQYEDDEFSEQRDSSLSGPARIGLAIGVFITGLLLLFLGKGLPPLAWRLLFQPGGATSPLRIGFLIVQALFFLIAWLLLLLVAIQVILPSGISFLSWRGKEQTEYPEQEALYSLLPTHLNPAQPQEQKQISTSEFWQYQPDNPNQQVPFASDAFDLDSRLTSSLLDANPFEQVSNIAHEPLKDALQPSHPFEQASSESDQKISLLDIKQELERLQANKQKEAEQNTGAVQSLVKELETVASVHTTRSSRQASFAQQAASTPLSYTNGQSKDIPSPIAVQEVSPPPPAKASIRKQFEGTEKMVLPQLVTLFTDSSRDLAEVVTHQTRLTQIIPSLSQGWQDWEAWSLCCPGFGVSSRKEDPVEDYLLITTGTRSERVPITPFTIAVLADGVDSSDSRHTTSRFITRTITEALLSILWRDDLLNQKAVRRLLIKGMQYANGVLYRENQKYETVKTATAIVLLILDHIAYFANVGDNRAYHYRASQGLVQVTSNHSSSQVSEEQGKIIPDEISQQSEDSQLHRVLGQQATIEVDTSAVPLHADDLLILCSDGLWKPVGKDLFHQTVEQVLSPPAPLPSLLGPLLMQTARAKRGDDHSSILIMHTKAHGRE